MNVFFLASVVLSCLSLLTNGDISAGSCPESFICPGLAPFKYPFYNATDPRCGLIKVECSSPYGAELKLGPQSHKIHKYDSGFSLLIHNKTFYELVQNERCEALTDNLTSPSPLSYTFSVSPFITLFKCVINLGYTQTDAYFRKRNYHSYNRCTENSFYYKYLINNETVPSDIPQSCQVIRLPVKELVNFSGGGFDETDIFSLVSPLFTVSFNFCHNCHKNGSRCHFHDGKFRCLDAETVGAKGPDRTLKLILGLTGSAIGMLSFGIFVAWWCCMRNPFSRVISKNKSSDLEDSRYFGVPVFSYNELKDATKNFDPSQELGDGGFGAVYYGKLHDGREVAVKRLYDHNYKRVQHFMNEVEILTRLRHPNLVVLYGCTSKQSRELLLVYEYISNGTVADHLHGNQPNRTLLPWRIRMNIAIETASALAYLHASEIIHRDVKTHNILLDLNFGVKVADFGLSRLIPSTVSHVSTAPQGTPGYVDPQYRQCYQLTDKSDVYSFGVVLVELITSMVAMDLSRARDEINLGNYALNRIQGDEIEQLIDPVLLSDSDCKTMITITSVAELAFRCLQFDSEMRPTMNEVLDLLMDIQAEGSTDPNGDSSRELETVNRPFPSENRDTVVLLKDFRRSPVSVVSEWQSDNSISSSSAI